jgi:hypothetical protein
MASSADTQVQEKADALAAKAKKDLRRRFTKLFATNQNVNFGFGRDILFPKECNMLLDSKELLRYVDHAPTFYRRLPGWLAADAKLIELILQTHGRSMLAQVTPHISANDIRRDCAITRLVTPIVVADPSVIDKTCFAKSRHFLRRVVAQNKDVLNYARHDLKEDFHFILTCMLVDMDVWKVAHFACLRKLTCKSQVETLLEAYDYYPQHVLDQTSPADQNQVDQEDNQEDNQYRHDQVDQVQTNQVQISK